METHCSCPVLVSEAEREEGERWKRRERERRVGEEERKGESKEVGGLLALYGDHYNNICQ